MNKRLRVILASILTMAMAFSFVACSAEDDGKKDKSDREDRIESDDDEDEDIDDEDSDEDETTEAEETTEVEETEEVDTSDADYELLYGYLESDLIPANGLASLDSVTLQMGDTGYHNTAAMEASYGIVSADVRDYNGDDTLDMVTFTLDNVSYTETSTGRVMGNYTDTMLALRVDFYTIEDGEVVLVDSESSICEMGADNFGTMVGSVFEENGTPYIVGYCYMEDTTTYGPTHSNIYHIQNDEIIFDQTYGSYGWGQSSTSNAETLSGSNNTNFDDTQLKVFVTMMRTTRPLDELVSFLGGAGKTVIKITPVDYGLTVSYNVVDSSLMRDVISNGIDVLSNIPPQPEFELVDSESLVESCNTIASRISDNSGVALSFDSSTQGETQFVARYVSPDGTTCSFRMDLEGHLVSIDINNSTGVATSEWIAIKDAAFQDPIFAFDPAVYSELLGDCGWNHDQMVGDGYSFMVGNAGTSVARISITNN